MGERRSAQSGEYLTRHGLPQLRRLTERLERKGKATPHHFGEALLEKLNVVPDFLASDENPKVWQEMRKRLNSEPGVLIANHPGGVDVSIILSMLDRTDVLTVVTPLTYEYLSAAVPEGYMIEAAEDVTKLRENLVKMKEHIQKGGLLVLFPAGGGVQEKHKFVFQSGLRHILESMRPTDMVYSCLFSAPDVNEASKGFTRHAGLYSELLTRGVIAPNRFRKKVSVKVDERISEASSWQKLAETLPKKKINHALTLSFLNQFLVPLPEESEA